MFYTVYRTTCLVNGKQYVGKHQTSNLEDNYLGSGKAIRAAVKKHGLANFKKEILHIFDNEEDMNKKEVELVTEEWCRRKDTYNLCEGGKGGWSYVNREGLGNFFSSNTQWRFEKGNTLWVGRSHNEISRMKISKALKGGPGTWSGKKHSEESKKKISQSKKGCIPWNKGLRGTGI